jgi:hypothetical protein
MHRDTRLKLYALAASDETTEQRIARLAAAAPPPPVEGQAQSLPTGDAVVDLAFMTKTELHDLIYAASSTYLQRLSQMPKTMAHTHASRIADVAMQMTHGQDYMTRGSDPRA